MNVEREIEINGQKVSVPIEMIDSQETNPPHPGKLVAEFMLPRIGMPEVEFQKKTRISNDRYAELSSGNDLFSDEEMRRLKNVFGKGVNIIKGAQENYVHYREYGEWHPLGGRPYRERKNDGPKHG